MKSSRRLAMSSSRSVTCSTPRRSSASSSACCDTKRNTRLCLCFLHSLVDRSPVTHAYPIEYVELLVLRLHRAGLPVVADFDPGNRRRQSFRARLPLQGELRLSGTSVGSTLSSETCTANGCLPYLVPRIDDVYQKAVKHSQAERQIHVAIEGRHWDIRSHSQGKVGQILDDLGGQGEATEGVGLWVRLRQAKERRTEDSRAQESQEEGSGDETLADLRSALVFTQLHPAREYLV
ncbi:hypothetical protein EYF80_057436 [Liparis tanakae]|uniref:Uncharacterized protein n=1 Tax=Liparis tanakae TaxID=230148 RepID=A0A4Z2EU11_9TELE|nr:hypothetical protein EYF80_057436 [Liparis tanakae]